MKTVLKLEYRVVKNDWEYMKKKYPLLLMRKLGTEKKYFGLFGPEVPTWLEITIMKDYAQIAEYIRKDAEDLIASEKARALRDGWKEVRLDVIVTVDENDELEIDIKRSDER